MRRAALPPLAIVLAIVTASTLVRLSVVLVHPDIGPVRATAAIGSAAQAQDPAAASAVRRFYDAVNAVLRDGDAALLAPVVARGFVDRAASSDVPATGADLAHELVGLRVTYPGMRLVIDDLFAAGDRVAVRLHAEGTDGGDFLGLPIPGGPTVWGPIDVIRVADDLVAERWGSRTPSGVIKRPLAEAPVAVAPAIAGETTSASGTWLRVSRFTIAPGTKASDPFSAGALVVVETGHLVATAAGGGGSDDPDSSPFTAATSLEPEAGFVVPTGAPTVFRNDGPQPAVAVVVEIGAASFPEVAPAVPPKGGADGGPGIPTATTEILVAASLPATAATVGETMAVGRLTLTAGTSFPTGTLRGLVAVVVERGTMTTARVGAQSTIGAGTSAVLDEGYAAILHNAGPDALSLLVVTVGTA